MIENSGSQSMGPCKLQLETQMTRRRSGMQSTRVSFILPRCWVHVTLPHVLQP